MAKIIITRTLEYNSRLRNYQLFVDGTKLGAIADAETKPIVLS